MPARFTRLRIAGFKSFAEPAVLEILPGLTGIVGPNGCGKSNVVEALRWAMGEASARSLRGGEMDDVIFAGTAHRPSRNIAEVVIGLDETRGLAPPPFHEAPELEVTRRIERGSGSSFRVNGREARARDVQTLFADLATGARASAMVSQGRVGALVGASPEERRGILEEAAGITGLHARRHEAELKLRATEANLARAEDLRGQLEGQLEGLRRQARQAARWRGLSELVRAAEAELLATQRAMAERARAAARGRLEAADAAVSEATATAARAGAAAAAAQAALPGLRSAEAAARSAMERARLLAQQVAEVIARAEAARREAVLRRDQTARDLSHARQAQEQAQAALVRLAAETTSLEAEADAAPARLAEAARTAAASGAALRAAEAAAEAAIARSAELGARHRAAAATLAAAGQRLRGAEAEAQRLAAERTRATAAAVPAQRLAAAQAARLAAEGAATEAEAALAAADAARGPAQQALAAARTRADATQSRRTRLAAEAQGLAAAMAPRGEARWRRMVDQVAVPAGLEAALGAALGEALDAADDASAPRYWQALPEAVAPALPAGTTPLASLIAAPAALARALAWSGLLEPDADGATLQAALAPGQSLVSRAGAVWRADGYCVQAGAPGPAAVWLQQRNRLAALQAGLAEAEAEADAARAARDAAAAAERDAVQAEQAARAAARATDQRRAQARDAAAALERQAAASGAQVAALEEAAARSATSLAEAGTAHAAAAAAQAALADAAAAQSETEQARGALVGARAAEAAARGAHESLERAEAQRRQRQGTLAAETADWRERAADSHARVTDLAARAAEAEALLAALLATPQTEAARQAQAAEVAEAAEAAGRAAADTLARADSEAAATERAARAAEAALARAREDRVRAEAAAAQADLGCAQVDERITERIGPHPALPDPPATCDGETEDKLRRRLERLQREREAFGPVNLRAEIEAAAIESQAETIARETADLATAIAKLRGSIGHINREGRERLGQVFADIDRHFRSLFETMFGGGRAHLALVGSDDPLLAGLEIYAQPPGKKLATLSLLSGGEQALTALSLIFAVFRCNPAPVCVLDEVDAPLDDANVERFCNLLETMVRETGTRFLVVTHHQLTMTRMDRLYGVTMQERGVSRLLSVDLSRAVAMAEPERLAAE